MIFPLKYFLFNALSIIKDSMPYLFSFLRYQIKCVIKFLFRQLMVLSTFEIYFGSSSRAMADREKKGEDGNKIWISSETSFIGLSGYHLVKNKNLSKNSGHKLS